MNWSFYDLGTGEFTGRRFSSPYPNELKIPDGCGAIEGAYDPFSWRVDLSNGQAIAYVARERIAEQELRNSIRAAHAEREKLEIEQIRSLSALFDDPNDSVARANYARRKVRIEELRSVINAETETTEPAS